MSWHCVLSQDDHMRREVIDDLMCRFRLDIHAWEQRWSRSFGDVFDAEKQHLEDCIEDGLLDRVGDAYEVTELGKIFVRNIAMGFDILGKREHIVVFLKVI